MIYVQLFLSFFQIGTFSFGGGYAAMPLIQQQVVSVHSWITLNEFTDLITISQMTPGPIAINAATFVGQSVAGPVGSLAATLGCILPSCLIVSALAWLYLKYKNLSLMEEILTTLRPAVVSFIASAGLTIIILAFWNDKGISFRLFDLNWHAVLIFAIAIILLGKYKCNPIFIMILSGLLEVLLNFIENTL